MIRVLYIVDSMFRAGTQTHIGYMVRGHDKSRFLPHILCLQEKGSLGEELEREGYRVTACGLKRAYALQAACSYPRYISFLKRERIDIVHAYLFSAQIYGVPGARLAGVPLVISGRRSAGKRWTARRYLMARRVSNSLSHLLVANAEDIKRFVVDSEGVSPEKVRVVLNGVDIERFSPAETVRREGAVTIGYVGSLTISKEVDLLLRALALILPSHPDLTLRIVGGGPTDQLRLKDGDTDLRLKRLAVELGLGDRVIFTGARNRVEDELKKMDIFVFPAVGEGTSNVLLEAMASALPVIASDSGGNRELVEENRTGFLFPPGDEVKLGKMIVNLAENGGKRRVMGLAARERVLGSFSLQRMVEEMERLYIEELDKRSRRG